MRSARASLILVAPLIFAGCGYVHFGRLPATATVGDSATAQAYSNLATEHKILKQELALVRKEGDTLRLALERTGAGAGAGTASNDLIARLNDTSRELTTLRASYAKLQAERASSPANADSAATKAARADLEEKLANSLRTYTQLQEENSRLRSEVERTKSENLGLTEQLKGAALQADRMQLSLVQLNTDLLAQKEARARAEQATEAVRAQLGAVLAHSAGPTAAGARETAASALQIAKAPPAESSPTAELRLNTERLRNANATTAAPPGEVNRSETPAKPGRVHIVQAGDTLEKIARQYFGAPDRWSAIYDANTALLRNGQPLRVGMELQIPDVFAPQKSN